MAKKRTTPHSNNNQKRKIPLIIRMPKHSQQPRSSPPKRRTDFSVFTRTPSSFSNPASGTFSASYQIRVFQFSSLVYCFLNLVSVWNMIVVHCVTLLLLIDFVDFYVGSVVSFFLWINCQLFTAKLVPFLQFPAFSSFSAFLFSASENNWIVMIS